MITDRKPGNLPEDPLMFPDKELTTVARLADRADMTVGENISSQLTIRRYVWILLFTSMCAALWIAATISWPRPFLISALQVIVASWLLVAVHCGYHVLREKGHLRRRRRDQRDREDLMVPPDVLPPTGFPEIDILHDLQRRAIGDTPDYQGRYRAAGVKVALLPTLAILFLSLQAIFFPGGGPAATGMVIAESLLLLALAVMVWTKERPTYDWVQSRVRAELFRREQYLLLAHVGPYLGLDDHRITAVRDMRIGLLTHADLKMLDQLAVMADREMAPPLRGDILWIDALWQAGDDGARSDTADRMRSYLHYRLRKQILWFRLGIGKCEHSERNITRLLKTAVLAAVAVAVAYATLLSTGNHLEGVPHTAKTALIAVFAAGLPPLCAGILAIRDIFGFQKLVTSYRETHGELLRYESVLQSLIAMYEEEPNRAPELQTRFRALVLHAESVLTQELQRWAMLVYKPQFEPTV